MKKEIDPFAVALMLFPIENLGGLEEAIKELWDKLPETDGGVEVEEAAFIAAVDKLYYDHAKPLIEDMLGGNLPPVSEDDLAQPEPETPEKFPGWRIFTESNCDAPDMNYGPGGNNQQPQSRCLFREIAHCSDMPDNFRIVWENAQGSQEYLDVRGNCSISMMQESGGYRKYRHVDDHYPHPVGYAPRGFNAVKAYVLIKNTD